MAKKFSRKQDLKQPDEFISLSMKIWGYIQANLKHFVIGLGVALVVIGGGWGITYYKTRQAEKETATLTKALEIYIQPTIDGEKKLPQADEDGIPRFATRTEKLKKTEEELGQVLKKASGAMVEVVLTIRGSVRYDLGKYNESIADYQAYLDKGGPKSFRFIALEGIGYSYEALKNYDKALEYFRMLNDEEGTRKYTSLFDQARVLAKQGKTQDAIKLYKEITKGTSGSLTEKASEQLALLESR